MKRFFVFFILMVCCATTARAESIAYQMGTTGYMIREAMQAKAYKYSPDEYRQAVVLQSKAKKMMHRGNKSRIFPTQSKELTLKAYDLAKSARDKALQAQGLKVSF